MLLQRYRACAPALAIVLLSLVGASAGHAVSAAVTDGVPLTLIYTTDIKGKIDPCHCSAHPRGGLAPRATWFNAVWDEGVATVTVDAGDLFGMRNTGDRDQTAFLCEQTASFGYDAIGLGEFDLHYGRDFLQQMIKDHGLPFTCANVRDAASGALLLPEWRIVERGGIRMGIVSVVDPQQRFADLDGPITTIRVDDPATTLRDVLPRLRQACDTVVLLSHLGQVETDGLLKAVPGIDVAVIGHTSRSLALPRYSSDVVVLAAAFEGRTIGRADLRLDPATGKVLATEVHVTDLDAQIGDDKEMAQRVAAYETGLGE